MKIIDKHNTIRSAKNNSDKAQKWSPPNGALSPPALGPGPNPADTAQEAVHEVMPKESVRKFSLWPPSKSASNAPLRAARGDDDLMSKQQQQSMPSVDELKGKWKQ